MAIPTITSTSPATAAARTLLEVRGTNFRLPTIPTSGPLAAFKPTVQVTIGSQTAPLVLVYAEDYLEALVPEYADAPLLKVFPALDLVVKNLDDSGVPIPGEEASKAAAFTYSRDPLRAPTLQTPTPYTKLTRQLLLMLMRQTLLNTTSKVNTDYSPDGIILQFAEVPALSLLGPRVIPDAYGARPIPQEIVQQDGSVQIIPGPEMHTFSYDIMGVTQDSDIELLNLMATTRKFFRENACITLAADLPEGAVLRFPTMVTAEPSVGLNLANANLQGFEMTFEVRNVPVYYLAADYRTWPVTVLELQTQKIQAGLVEIINL